MNLRAAMRGLAHLLTRRQDPTLSPEQADQELLAAMGPGLRDRIRVAMSPSTVIASPQSILLAMRLALRICPADGGHAVTGELVRVILALQDDLDAPAGPSSAPDPLGPDGHLFREIVRGQSLAARWDHTTQMAHFQLRWHEYPAALGRAGDASPADPFEKATGVALKDLTGLGTAFWAGALRHPGRIVPFPAGIEWDEDRRERAVALFSSRVPDMRSAVSRVTGDAEIYAFDEFRRWPVLRLADDEFLVLAPDLLFDRVFGWPPMLDIKASLPDPDPQKRWDRLLRTHRDMCEHDALEGLRHIAESDRMVFYSEDDLRWAYGGRGVRIADAAIDTGDGWLVAEVSSRRLTRPTVIDADAEALRTDLDRGVRQKFLQIDSIVDRLIDDQTRLTRAPARARHRFTRVLVVADGFPVNPMTYEAIQQAVPSPANGADPRIGPGHVVDQEELDIAESISERQEATLPSLLAQHERASLMRAAFKDFLLVELKLDVPRPARLTAPGHEAWGPAFQAYGRETAHHDDR